MKDFDAAAKEANEIFSDPKKDIARMKANIDILKLLSEYLSKNPNQRFCQALRNIGVVDTVSAVPQGKAQDSKVGLVRPMFSNEFYTESEETLKKVRKRLEEQ